MVVQIVINKGLKKMYQNYIKYNTKTVSKSIQNCSPLLCYRKANRTNSCENAIANLQGSSYSPLLHYHYVSTSLTVQIPSGNVLNMTNSK